VPAAGKGSGVFFRVVQGSGYVGSPIQGIHKQNPADNGFNIADALNQAGNFQPGFPGKGNKMEGIAYAEEFPEKGTDKVIAGLRMGTAHTGRGIQENHQIHGTACLGRRPERDPDAE
jgi:hypothetical protein